MRKKLYLVKYEVIATTAKKALETRGIVCEVILAEEKNWPEITPKKLGFKNKK